jgi:hypothetical protein
MSLRHNDNSMTDHKSWWEYFICCRVSELVHVTVWICRRQFLDMDTEKLIECVLMSWNTGKFMIYPIWNAEIFIRKLKLFMLYVESLMPCVSLLVWLLPSQMYYSAVISFSIFYSSALNWKLDIPNYWWHFDLSSNNTWNNVTYSPSMFPCSSIVWSHMC